MRRFARLSLAVTIPLLVAGWAVFRPELLFVGSTVDERSPAESRVIAAGTFQSYAHETSGKAELLDVGGRAVLRLSNFQTSNGPDVRVYLVKGADPGDGGVKGAGFVDLGRIKGTMGNQNYELPANVMSGDYRAVSIWCARFGVNFGGATLG